MDCGLTRQELIPFHFGECEAGTRAYVESHLLACRECLTAWLELKRALEASADSGPSPSAAARARLREAVAHEIGRHPHQAGAVAGAVAPRGRARAGATGRLGAAIAGAAAMLLVVLAVQALRVPPRRAAPALPDRAVDTARPPDPVPVL